MTLVLSVSAREFFLYVTIFETFVAAGGFDAVFAVVLGQGARHVVDAEWSKRGTLALCAMEDSCGVVVEESDPRQRA